MLECHPDWAPSLNLGHSEDNATTAERFERLCSRRKAKQQPATLHQDTGAEADQDNIADENHAEPNITAASKDVELEQIGQQNEEKQECRMSSLRLQEIAHLQEENRKLKEELSEKNLDEDFLKDNDAKVKFYTGLPSFALLMGVLMQIRPSLPTTERKLSHFQMLLLTFMRLRLNLPLDHIAQLFNISCMTTSNLFNSAG